MIQIILGSILLTVIHAFVPNHWIPLLAIGKVEHWSRRETLSATAIAGLALTLSTIIIGAGPAGISCALAVKNKNLNAVILNKKAILLIQLLVFPKR